MTINFLRPLSLVGFCLALYGCASTSTSIQPNSRTASVSDVASGNYAQLTVCRVNSVKRGAEAPELRIDKAVVGQVGSGGRVTVKIKPETMVDLFLESNPFMYRFGDLVLRSKKMARGESVYWVIVPEANLMSGITVFLGGAAAEATRQKSTGQLGNWSVSDVAPEDFDTLCSTK